VAVCKPSALSTGETQHRPGGQGQDRTADFRLFRERGASGSRASGRSECSGHASSSLLDCLGRGMAAIDEDGEEPGNDHQRKPNCGSPAISGPLTPVTSGLSRTPHPAGQARRAWSAATPRLTKTSCCQSTSMTSMRSTRWHERPGCSRTTANARPPSQTYTAPSDQEADRPTGRRRAGVPPTQHRARGPTARARA